MQTTKLLWLIILLNIVDTISTIAFLNYGGAEANPVMNHFLHSGMYGFVIAKACLVTFYVGVILHYIKNHPTNSKLLKVAFIVPLGWYSITFMIHVVTWIVIIA